MVEADKDNEVVQEDVIEINGMGFTKLPGVRYLTDYYEMVRRVKSKDAEWADWDELSIYREAIQTDLFFILYFVLKIRAANHPFVVARCREVDTGPDTMTLDLWAREHYKTVTLSIAKTIQRLAKDRNRRIGIFSYAKPAAVAILRSVKHTLEESKILHACFPDVFYANPKGDSLKWAEETGLYVMRDGYFREPSISAHGLLEGMPTGSHFTDLIYDDVETEDSVGTPEIIAKLKRTFFLSSNLGTMEGTKSIIGTTYSHEGLLEMLRYLKDQDGNPVYTVRVHPATDTGEPNGKSVLLPESRLAELRADRYTFNAQQLLNPTPLSEAELSPDNLIEISAEEIPNDELWKFMVIDPAGIYERRQGDSWAIHVVGVEPYSDDIGASNIYILDSVIQPLKLKEAMDTIIDMYMRNGRVIRIGVEKVAASTTEVHVQNALRARGKYLTVENKGIHLLRPGGRKKENRILEALAWPLQNGKVMISKAIPSGVRDRLKTEMRKFPFYKDDGLDALSYIYDIIKTYRFGPRPPVDERDEEEEARWRRAKQRMDNLMGGGSDSWMVV